MPNVMFNGCNILLVSTSTYPVTVYIDEKKDSYWNCVPHYRVIPRLEICLTKFETSDI